MDWTTPLRCQRRAKPSQQTDFIQRLKSGCLLHCEIQGQHSELTVISGERLQQLRDFCWEMADKYKRNSSVRKVFIDNMKGKLAEEVVQVRLIDLVTEVDYEKRISSDGKVDFRLNSDPAVGIQVKSRHGSINTIQWSISKEEVEKNAVLVCILIQEEVNEAQTEYNLIIAGFLPTNFISMTNSQALLGINELLYGGGLRSYLESVQYSNQTQELLTELSSTITIKQSTKEQQCPRIEVEHPHPQSIQQAVESDLERVQILEIRNPRWIGKSSPQPPGNPPLKLIAPNQPIYPTQSKATKQNVDTTPISGQLVDPYPVANDNDELSFEGGINSNKLEDLLAAGKWEEADQETIFIMLRASHRSCDHRSWQGWLRVTDITRLSCICISTIDQLWVKYSNGHFGFSVQKRIYDESKSSSFKIKIFI